MKAALLALLLPGCTLALLGDARDACYRVEDAISAYQQRCEVDFHGRLDDCGAILLGATTSSSVADECAATLQAAPCSLRTLPSECRIEGL